MTLPYSADLASNWQQPVGAAIFWGILHTDSVAKSDHHAEKLAALVAERYVIATDELAP